MLKISGAVLSAALLVSIFAVSPANAAVQLSVTDNTLQIHKLSTTVLAVFLGVCSIMIQTPQKG
jgi:hypothetical protein